ncbi:MAG TPA: hypothetical protein VK116_04600 [Planctomycetota bacterium]|nr:hypothetical protein [Planctomycetota bacterium]
MRSRPTVVIVILGLLAMVAFGLLSHFAFEQSPSLKKVARLKTEILERFGPRGVEKVSYRLDRHPGGRTIVLGLETSREDVSAEDPMLAEIAELVATDPPNPASQVEISFTRPRLFGLLSSEPFAETRWTFVEIRQAMIWKRAVAELTKELEAEEKLDVIEIEARRPVSTIRLVAPSVGEDRQVDLGRVVERAIRVLRLHGEDRVAIELLRPKAALAESSPRPPVANPPRGGNIAHAQEPSGAIKTWERVRRAVFDSRGRPLPGGE